MANKPSILNLATYMCPSVPVEYYEFLAEYLETQLKYQTALLYNSRKPGPDSSRGDQHRIDIGMLKFVLSNEIHSIYNTVAVCSYQY